MSERYGPKADGGMASSTKTPATAGVGDDAPKALDADGSIGKQFTEQGAIGGMAQKIGGPLDKDGVIGKQFTTEGSIGGTVQDNLGGVNKKSN
ncbi:hypothetical protein UCRPA7_6203 [Phaeoacremonium minimum UCRPA7]|uniref:Uncharacterized protein n=1 Tax=Phaeoacremonium minimum (strain UCR-PA7) TaxID=1286976 RepID=R8BG13_PHAM7|nr:hypothetical protein UCRPA7_6203 [Phaeoacremonium minimum UCRPA7]EON98235.1 hypothetical protein UCRPA7_6203 [Phaeoacremonium minimum UCRPA7]